jgi:sodium-dependent dicarboxylate transporter 2/3/5
MRHDMEPPSHAPARALRRLGLCAGPLLAALAWAALPESYVAAGGERIVLGQAGRAAGATAVWMATWWMTEAIPIPATALLPLVLLPVSGATTMREASAPYGHELIFLFLGGFVLALALERWGLHERIALRALRLVGTQPNVMVAGIMGVTAGLSMWVSNTATTITMLPIALSVIGLVTGPDPERGDARTDPEQARRFSLCLLIGIAYAASIGGIGTIIGTPPNGLLVSYVADHLGREISFARWMAVGLPLVAVFLPIAWWLLTRVVFPVREMRLEGGGDVVRDALARLGPMKRGERATLAIFLVTVGLWVFRPLLVDWEIFGVRPCAGLSDASVAILAALALFSCPLDRRLRSFVMDWETAVRLPWGILILFGGGLSLAAAIQKTGLGLWLGHQVGGLAGLPSLALVVVVTALVIFLTELTSNTATTATLVPILAALAPGLGLSPFALIVPAAIAASCAFMLPVATPPNAVVFASGHVTIPQMARAGFALNLIGIALITALTYAVALPLLGVSAS